MASKVPYLPPKWSEVEFKGVLKYLKITSKVQYVSKNCTWLHAVVFGYLKFERSWFLLRLFIVSKYHLSVSIKNLYPCGGSSIGWSLEKMTICFPQDWPGRVKDPCSGGKPGEERVYYPGSRQSSVVPWLKREPQWVSPAFFIYIYYIYKQLREKNNPAK